MVAGRRKAPVVSSYDLVRTLRRDSPQRSQPTTPGPSRAGTVALPPRRFVACPDCGWETEVTGRVTMGVCPRCRKKFDVIDYTIDSEISGLIRTGGIVRLAPDGSVRHGEVRAAEVEVAGYIEEVELYAWRRLAIRSGGRCDVQRAHFRDLELDAGVWVECVEPLHCRRAVIKGDFLGTLIAEECIVIASTGAVRGAVVCRQLCVEDGARLVADVRAGTGEIPQ